MKQKNKNNKTSGNTAEDLRMQVLKSGLVDELLGGVLPEEVGNAAADGSEISNMASGEIAGAVQPEARFDSGLANAGEALEALSEKQILAYLEECKNAPTKDSVTMEGLLALVHKLILQRDFMIDIINGQGGDRGGQVDMGVQRGKGVQPAQGGQPQQNMQGGDPQVVMQPWQNMQCGESRQGVLGGQSNFAMQNAQPQQNTQSWQNAQPQQNMQSWQNTQPQQSMQSWQITQPQQNAQPQQSMHPQATYVGQQPLKNSQGSGVSQGIFDLLKKHGADEERAYYLSRDLEEYLSGGYVPRSTGSTNQSARKREYIPKSQVEKMTREEIKEMFDLIDKSRKEW